MVPNRSLTLVILLPLLWLTGTSWAEDTADLAYAQQDYRRAYRMWLEQAEQGNLQAAFMISEMFATGRGTKQDPFKAMKWLRIAAEGGNANAQSELGNRYYHGNGVPRNFEQAIGWWQLASASNQPEAQFNLGFAYDRGTGVPPDPAQARYWFELAASNGSMAASRMLDELASRAPVVSLPPLELEFRPLDNLEPPRPKRGPSPLISRQLAPDSAPRIASVGVKTPAPAPSIATGQPVPFAVEPGAVPPPAPPANRAPSFALASSPNLDPAAQAAKGNPNQPRSVPMVEARTSPAPPKPAITESPPLWKMPPGHCIGDRDPSRFTVQVFAGADEQTARTFAKDASNHSPCVFATRSGSGLTWGVTIGNYPDRVSAAKARDQLPLDIWKRPGWFRSFGELQQDLVR